MKAIRTSLLRRSQNFCLRGLWVFAYAFLVKMFLLLRWFERGSKDHPSGDPKDLPPHAPKGNSPGTPERDNPRIARSHETRAAVLLALALATCLGGGEAVFLAQGRMSTALPAVRSGLTIDDARFQLSSSLPTAAGWHQMPGTHLEDVCPPNTEIYPFHFYCKNVIASWNGGIADQVRNRMIIWGGGHGDYYGNELYALDLNTQKLTRLNNPSPPNGPNPPVGPNIPCIETLPDGKPNSRHSYGGMAYIAHADRMFVFGGSLACSAGDGGSDTWTLNLATLQWHQMNPVGGMPSAVGLAAVADYDPNTKNVFLHDRKSLWLYNYDKNIYKRLNQFDISVSNNGVIDPKRRLFFIVGRGEHGEPQWLSISLGRRGYNPDDWTPKLKGCEALAKAEWPGLAYDAVQDRIVGWKNEGDTSEVFIFDPDAKTCVKQTFPGGPPLAPETRGVFGRWRYFAALDAFVVLNDWQQNAYLLRLASSAGADSPSTVDSFQVPAPSGMVGTSASTNASGAPKVSSTASSLSTAVQVPGVTIAQQQTPPATVTGSSPTDTDFAARCAMPGVVLCYGFDDPIDAERYLALGGGVTPKLGAIDSSVKASGAGSLRFTIPSRSDEGDAGSFPINFSSDLSARFGEGDEFYVQWRQRFSREFLNTHFKNGDGWKQVIISSADRPGHVADACTDLEIVVQNVGQRGFPQLYHSCGVKDGEYEPLVVYRGGVYELQNATKPPCLWNQERMPPCIGYKPDQWMTFQIHVKIGHWYKNDKKYHRDSTVQLWVAEEGKPSKLVIDFGPKSGDSGGYDLVNTDPEDKYGKIWLTPYHTHKDANQEHLVAYTWYEELIVSRNRIPDPGQPSSGGRH